MSFPYVSIEHLPQQPMFPFTHAESTVSRLVRVTSATVYKKITQQYVTKKYSCECKKKGARFCLFKRLDSKKAMLETRSAIYKMMKEEAHGERQVGKFV